MIGRKVLHYQITEKLGEGGMGVVYKAEDTKLDRTVALKFLSPQVIDSLEEQQRLINEARAAAGIHHPNICTIYEINEYEGQTFIAMAYVDGCTLRDKVLSDRISVADSLRYLLQIAEGLKQAHGRDIVHRDIKSANIMVNSAGRAVIMDFGLARRTGQIKGDERFSSGGTSAYMSPEQARGEGVDQRTDIWSLGVVLYEMLAGQLPFRGDYEQAVIYSILNEEPKPVREVRPEVPEHVAKIVEKCLAKNPDDRYQTLDELTEQIDTVLARVTGVRRGGMQTAHPRRRALGLAVASVLTIAAAILVVDFLRGQFAESEERIPIAVIDFTNQTGQPEMDGLSGMLITALEQSRRLSVLTRTRMFDVLKTLGGGDVSRIDESTGQEICRAVDVGALVIPSIRRFGNLYTIDLKVLDTRNNRYIFTTKEEGEGEESIPGMIDKIARGIRVDLNEATQEVASTKNVADVTTVNLEAYQRYFEGERNLNDLDFKKAHELFEQAISLDSTFALAYYRLAYTEWWSRGQMADAQKHVAYAVAHMDRIPEKERYLVRALEAGLTEGFEAQTPIYREMSLQYPNDKEMLFGLGDAEFHSLNNDSAQVHFERVLQLDPSFDRALQHLTWTYLRLSRFDKAEETARKWVDVTGSGEAYSYLATTLFAVDKKDEALATLEKAEKLDPDNFMVRQLRAELYLSDGHPELAEASMKAIFTSDQGAVFRAAAGRTLGECVYPYMGRFKDAENILNQSADLAVTAEGDSSAVLLSILARANLWYWAHSDTAGCREIAEKSLAFPEKYKTEPYWKSLAVSYLLAGNEAAAVDIFDHRLGHMGAEERGLYEVLHYSLVGQCDSALVAMRSIPEMLLENAKGLRLTLGRCLVGAGDYDRAVEQLEKLTDEKHIRINAAAMIVPAYVLLGHAYEGQGNAARAEASYRKALEIWKNADKDVPMRIDAETRLKALVDAKSM